MPDHSDHKLDPLGISQSFLSHSQAFKSYSRKTEGCNCAPPRTRVLTSIWMPLAFSEQVKVINIHCTLLTILRMSIWCYIFHCTYKMYVRARPTTRPLPAPIPYDSLRTHDEIPEGQQRGNTLSNRTSTVAATVSQTTSSGEQGVESIIEDVVSPTTDTS